MNDIKPENVVWIFGTARTGSTWLGSVLGEPAGHLWWEEPLVGRLFGQFYAQVLPNNPRRKTFIMSNQTREAWLDGIRCLFLNVANAVFPEAGPEDHLVVQEPNGSIGAPLLMEALPESRMVLLVRDPRDAVASAFGRHRSGGDAYQKRQQQGRGPRKDRGRASDNRADSRPNAFVKGQAERYLRNVGNAKEAFVAHGGPKILVRYEDLRADTLGTVKRISATLGLPAGEEELARSVEKHAWENIPEEEKGEGKFYRKAEPGGWREDLTPEQARIVEDVTAPLLEEFYPVGARSGEL